MTYITYEQFERDYAERSGFTVYELREHGLHPMVCNCDEDGCPGWKMAQAIYPCKCERCVCTELTDTEGGLCPPCSFHGVEE